jgi:hypothetical protein
VAHAAWHPAPPSRKPTPPELLPCIISMDPCMSLAHVTPCSDITQSTLAYPRVVHVLYCFKAEDIVSRPATASYTFDTQAHERRQATSVCIKSHERKSGDIWGYSCVLQVVQTRLTQETSGIKRTKSLRLLQAMQCKTRSPLDAQMCTCIIGPTQQALRKGLAWHLQPLSCRTACASRF